jgi:acetoin utilization deacetylase AcuC-like enzyme
MATGLVHDERYFWVELGSYLPLGPDRQPFPAMDSPDGKRRILNLFRASGIMQHLAELAPQMASESQLTRIHTQEYVGRVKALSDAYGGEVGDFTALCAGGYDFARLAVGGCIAACDAVLTRQVKNAFALVRPCGHHAERDRGRGFAIFANVALAVMDAKARHGIARAAVVDWDVHHGNGTQWAFYRDPSVLTISIHQDRLYPIESGGLEEIGEGEGEGYNINVPLPPGSGHGAYVETVRRVVVPALQAFKPDLIAVACGFDANALDPLGHMLCHSETYREMTALLAETAEQLCDGRLVVCLEGGYSPAYIPYCAIPVIETMADVRTDVRDYFLDWIRQMGGQDLLPHQSQVIDSAVQLVARLRRAPRRGRGRTICETRNRMTRQNP